MCTPFKCKREAVYLTSEPPRIEKTPLREIDDAVRGLDVQKNAWQLVSCAERANLLEMCLQSLPDVAREAAKAATDAHGSYGTGIGEEL